MNQKNYEFLRDQLLYSGFGESMDASLRKAMKQEKSEFTLNFKRDDEKELIAAQLKFAKSKQSDLYFFNGYQLRILDKKSRREIKQHFYVNGRDRYTLKEAYNLLHGRAVQKELTPKEGERYTAWVQLDFKAVDIAGNRKFLQYHQNYGFDLQKELERLPIQELQFADSKHYLMMSLQRGNRQQVTFLLADGNRKVDIEANPKFKSLAIYEGAMRLQFVSNDLGKEVIGTFANPSGTQLDTERQGQQADIQLTKGKKL